MKFKKILSFIMVFTVVGVLAACSSKDSSNRENSVKADEKVLNVGTAAGRSPFIYQKDNKVIGYDADVIEAAAKKAGYKVKWTTADFEGLFGSLDSGRIDTIANQLSVTTEREEKYTFTVPYLYSGSVFAVKANNDNINSIDDLKGKVVGVGLGTAAEKELKDINKNNDFTIKTFSEDPTAELKEVSLGRVDAYYNDQVQVNTTIEKAKLDDVKIGFGPTSWGNIAFPFTTDSKKVEDISKALQELTNDGTLKKISEKWLGIDATKKQ